MSNGFIEKYPATPVDRFKGDLRPKTHPSFYVIILMILGKKEPCAKFCGVLISSHEVVKLKSSESGASDAILGNVPNISSLVFFAYLC